MRTSWPRPAALLRLRVSSGSSTPPVAPGNPKSEDAANPITSYLADLLADTREELTRADSKAALLLAATGVVIGALLAGLLNRQWTPFNLDYKVEWIWWVGVGCAAAGTFSIAAAVYPRTHRRGAPHPGVPAYYGDVAAYEDISQFRRAIQSPPNAEERLADQVFQISRIVQRKYALLRRGLQFLLLAILACVAAVIINIPLSH